MCTRACPRFRTWETEIDTFMFGRERTEDEVAGISSDIVLARATDPELLEAGQDGGLVSAILVWALEHDAIDAALVSALESGSHMEGRTRGSARPRGSARHGGQPLHVLGQHPRLSRSRGPGCRAHRSRRDELSGLCPRCDVDPQGGQGGEAALAHHRAALLEDLRRRHLLRAVRGRVTGSREPRSPRSTSRACSRSGSATGATTRSLSKRGTHWTREGCKACPDFAAEHADIATGGIGAFSDWTLTIIRTEQGRQIIDGMIADGAIETRPGDDDPGAIELLRKLARVSRRRWPETAVDAPRRIPVKG